MPTNLTTSDISDTFGTLLHFNTVLPVSGFAAVFDGVGNRTALNLGRTDVLFRDDIYAQSLYTRDNTLLGIPNLAVRYSQLNSDLTLYLNRYRSDQSTDYFLNVSVRDGKDGEIARFKGDDKSLLVKGDIIAFHTSDKNLKDDIKNIDNPLDKISKLNGVTFNWNDKQITHTGSDVGVIAQDVEEVIPEAVTTRDNGYKAVNYEKIIPLLIESIKELKNKNDALEAKLTSLGY